MSDRFNPGFLDKVKANIGRFTANVVDPLGGDGVAANARANADRLDFDYNGRNGTQPFYQIPSNNTTRRNTGESATTGGGGYSSGPSGADLAYLDSQEAALRRQYGRADSSLSQGLRDLIDSYNNARSDANLQRGREIENLTLKREDTGRAKDNALDRVNTNARMLADSLRRRIGMASGSDSSAYKITAPGAVAREASGERGDVMEDYGVNFRNLDLTERRANEDFDSLLKAIDADKRSREGKLRSGVEMQRQSIDEALAQIAAQRASASGGDVRAALAPYEAQIASRDRTIDSLFNKYRNVGKFNPVKVNAPTLRDYMVDKTAVQANEQTGSDSPYSPYLPNLQSEDDEELMV